jgi:hypothetical protein
MIEKSTQHRTRESGTGLFSFEEPPEPTPREALRGAAALVRRLAADGGHAMRRVHARQAAVDQANAAIDAARDPYERECAVIAHAHLLDRLYAAQEELAWIEGRPPTRLAYRPPEHRQASMAIRRPRPRGAGRPAGRRSASSSRTASCDPGDSDPPGPCRRGAARGRWSA